MDYRDLEDRSADLQAKAEAIKDKAKGRELSAAEQDKVDSFEMNATSYALVATEWKQKEQAELRDIVAHGRPLTGGIGSSQSAKDLRHYLRTGEVLNAALSTTDANGGYVVAEPLHASLVEKVRKIDPIFGLAHHFDLSGGDTTMVLPYKSAHGVVTNATETGARSEQSAPTFTGPTLACYDYYTDQRATQTLVDSIPGFEDLLLGWIYQDIYEQAGVDFAVGNGTTKASGLFAATSTYTTKLSGSAGALVNTNFLTVYTALHPRYRPNAVWLMNSATLAVVSTFVLPNTQTPLVDWSGEVPRILGKPVFESTSAPDIGAANFPVAFGNLSAGYAVGLHRMPSVLRDPYTVTPYIRYYGLARIGGCPWDSQAIMLLKSNNS